MRRIDRIKLDFTRNWKLPGKERLSHLFKPSAILKAGMKDGIVWLYSENIAIYADADNYIEWTIISTGTYEEEMNKLIRVSLKKGGNALDIGGNIGLQSIRMSQCVEETGKVYAFEPLNYLQHKLKKNLLLNKVGNVTLFPCALADTEGEANFSIDKHVWNQGNFSLFNKGEGTEKQLVIIRVGDNIPEIQHLESLDLIKIDVEGFEYQVLLGLRQTLEKHKPRIIFEYDSHYWIQGAIFECFSFLKSLNYSLYQITPVGCELINNVESVVGGNLFCLPG